MARRNDYRTHEQRTADLERVRQYLAAHLGAVPKDVANDLGMTYWLAAQHMRMIREAWRRKE